MKYISTRNNSKEFNFSEVFIKGLADDGGLFIPKTVPKLSNEKLQRFSNLNYQDLAKEIIFLFCNETIEKNELSNITELEDGTFSYNEEIISMKWGPEDKERSPRKEKKKPKKKK